MSEEISSVDKVPEPSSNNEAPANSASELKEELPAQVDKNVVKEEKEKPTAKRKVDILLKATGDAPIMKTRKWAVESDRTVGSIIEFVKRYLKMDATESIFLYVNQCFAPSPDQIILNLYECFGSDGKLVLHYCKTPAWG